jgi:hypothetical protein
LSFKINRLAESRVAFEPPVSKGVNLKFRTFSCKFLHNGQDFASYLLDFACSPLASPVHLYLQTTKVSQSWEWSFFGGTLPLLGCRTAMPNSTGGTMVKKFTFLMLGIFIFIVSGSVFSGAIELHNVISGGIQHFDSFPESGWLIVIGSLLISGATFLRRRRAARSR